MVKETKKPSKIQNNTINSVLSENKTPPKSRQQINQANYQKNKEKLKQRQQERYQQQKEQEQLEASKYYQASNIKVLLSLKEYTELSKEKMKFWLDFNQTLKDTNQSISGIVDIMKLAQVADNLIRDYWETAKGKIRQGIRSWNSLSEEQQAKLIKYWGREKVRNKENFAWYTGMLEEKGEALEKEIELLKFHEERGKKGCDCWQCAESKQIRAEVKEQLFKEETEEKTTTIESECSNCYEYKKVHSETGICKKCSRE